jgi:hypothetical protein
VTGPLPETNFTPGEESRGAQAVQRRAFTAPLVRKTLNCDICRAEMCTSPPLSRLRCAECQQIAFEQLWDGVLRNVLLVSVGFAVGSLIVRNIERREWREEKSPSLKGPRGKVNEDYRATAA